MPNRIIKESICTSDTIEKLSWFEEVFFYRLMVNVDDYGRFDARPAILKARMFPLKANVTEKTVEQALNKLMTVGLASTYKVEDKPILQLSTWERHQHIRNTRSKYPGPECADLISIDINCNQSQSTDINCNQSQSTDINCTRNPIQSNPNPNPNPNPILFDAFWMAYPKHAAKADAEKAFTKLAPDDELMATILKAIEIWKKTEQWTKDGGKFVPLPATYIRGKRWEDELPKATARPSKEVGAHRYDQRQYTESQLDAGTGDLVAEALRARNA